MFDVITVGSNTLDVFVNTDSELIKIYTLKTEEDLLAYPVGSKIIIKELQFFTGGGGTNTAVSFARLGLKTGYLGKIGNDTNGEQILRELKQEKITFLGTKGSLPTGYSVILDSIEHDRTILTYRGANETLSFKECKPRNLRASWFYFCSMTGEAYNTLEKLARFAAKNNIPCAFNPSNFICAKGKDFLRPLYPSLYVLIMNKEEATLLVGEGTIEKQLQLLKSLITPEGVVVITDGKNGAYAYDGKDKYTIIPHGVKIKETTGAGDAFASSFVAGILKGKPIPFALQMGLANAESVIMHYGAKNKLLSWKEILQTIKQNPGKIKKERLS
ncbi:carbohydrate kinase family protein [Candidatus Woesearchaeota archaeon]|nr:carbohydrate kinase family protein [Candidatus Woesearchaeota archaeon]